MKEEKDAVTRKGEKRIRKAEMNIDRTGVDFENMYYLDVYR